MVPSYKPRSNKEKKQALILPSSFYADDDVVAIGRALLGKMLYTHIDGELTGGMIIETESYRGPEDRACHAYGGRRTTRTEVMFQKGGICYVYLCYGIHYLLNVVTGSQDNPHAVLIRSLEPLEGIETMLLRRKKKSVDSTLTKGPGSVSSALGIDLTLNGASLQGPHIWIEEYQTVTENQILATPRIGVDYAGEDALLPWRFTIK